MLTFSFYYSYLSFLHVCNAPINVLPHPTPLGIIWGYSGDLTYPDVKCPIEPRQTECVKSPSTAPHKPQLQHGDLTWPHVLKALSIYAFIKCPIVGK